MPHDTLGLLLFEEYLQDYSAWGSIELKLGGRARTLGNGKSSKLYKWEINGTKRERREL